MLRCDPRTPRHATPPTPTPTPIPSLLKASANSALLRAAAKHCMTQPGSWQGLACPGLECHMQYLVPKSASGLTGGQVRVAGNAAPQPFRDLGPSSALISLIHTQEALPGLPCPGWCHPAPPSIAACHPHMTVATASATATSLPCHTTGGHPSPKPVAKHHYHPYYG